MTVQLLTKGPEIGIVTTNLEAMLGFYHDFLGLEVQGDLEFPGGKMKRLALGESVLKLVTYDVDPKGGVIYGGGEAARGIRYLSIAVTNVREMLDKSEREGIEIGQGLTEFSPGIWYFFVVDPDGNWLEIAGPA